MIRPLDLSMTGCFANEISAARSNIPSNRWLAASSSRTPPEKTLKPCQ